MIGRFANLSKISTIAYPFSMKTSSPLDKQKDLILIRHAQSNFNKGFLDFRELNKLDISWDQCIQIEEFNKAVSYAKEFIDCSITEKGKLQCKKAREMLANEDVDIVLVSPHQRALQTCREIFQGRNIKVQVHPILAQVFRYSCDISNHNDQKIKQFPVFDFSFMKDHSELWFVEIMSEHIKNTCNKHFQLHGELTFAEKQHKLLELMQSKVVYESPQELRMRTWKIKELVREYRKQYKKIAIVSHFYTLGTLIASQFNEMGEVVEFQQIENATPFYTSIDRLLSIK